jgi:hypothetical protein
MIERSSAIRFVVLDRSFLNSPAQVSIQTFVVSFSSITRPVLMSDSGSGACWNLLCMPKRYLRLWLERKLKITSNSYVIVIKYRSATYYQYCLLCRLIGSVIQYESLSAFLVCFKILIIRQRIRPMLQKCALRFQLGEQRLVASGFAERP